MKIFKISGEDSSLIDKISDDISKEFRTRKLSFAIAEKIKVSSEDITEWIQFTLNDSERKLLINWEELDIVFLQDTLKVEYLLLKNIENFVAGEIRVFENLDEINKFYTNKKSIHKELLIGAITKDINKIFDIKGVQIFSQNVSSGILVDFLQRKLFDSFPFVAENCCSECGSNCTEMTKSVFVGERSREDCKTDRKKIMTLSINEKEITIVPFVQRIFKSTIGALIDNLKDCPKGNIKIEIDV